MEQHELSSQPTTMGGEASRVSLQDKLSSIASQPAVLRATIHITRKATGLTETYELTGSPVKEQ
jgi:hypothetical protein